MALTEAELRYLNDEDEEKTAGLTAQESAYLNDEEYVPPPPPTLGESAQHIGARWGAGLLDVADLPAIGSEAVDAVSGFFPEATKAIGEGIDALGEVNYLPVALARMARENMPGFLTGDERATDVIPGLQQARQLSDEYTLSEEQLNQAPVTEALGAGAEWLGLPGLSAGAAAVKGGAKALPDALRLAGREAKVAGAMSGGAAGGQYVGDELLGEAGGVGEMVGGVTGLVTALATGNVGQLSSNQRDMLNALLERFGDRETALEQLRSAVDRGEVGTLLDLTGDRNIANVEAALERTQRGSEALPPVQARREEQIFNETTQALQDDIPLDVKAEMSSQRAATEVGNRVRGEQNRAAAELDAAAAETEGLSQAVNAQARQAQEAADAAKLQAEQASQRTLDTQNAVDPGGMPSDYSTAAATRYDAAESAYKEEVSAPAWKAYDDGPDVDTIPLRDAANDYYRGLKPEERQLLNEKYQSLIAPLSKFTKEMSPTSVSLRIQQMKQAITKAINDGTNGWEEKKLGELVGELEKALIETHPQYAAAKTATKEGKDRFGPGYVGDVREANEPETLLANMGLQGDRGAATARLLEQSKIPELQEDVGNYILAQATRARNLDDQFLTQYEAVLNNLPPSYTARVRELINTRAAEDAASAQADQAAKTATQTTEQAAAEQARLTKALEAQEKNINTRTESLVKSTQDSILAQYGKGFEEADRVVDDILTRPDGAERLAALRDEFEMMDSAQGLGADMLDSFRVRVKDRVQAQLFDVFNAAEGQTPEQFRNALGKFRNMRRRLVQEGLLSEANAAEIDELLQRVETKRLRDTGRAAVGDVMSSDTESTSIIASILSMLALEPLSGTANLQMSGALRRYFKKGLEVPPTRRNIKALTEYITDPEAFLAGIEKLDTPEAQAKFVLQKLLGATQAAEIIGE
jgi:hypothetical protein